jgi:aryl-alcohol dehydrogenase-like predicted oxidoreductase
MLQRPFGDTGLTVSSAGFGAGHIGEDEYDDAAAGRLLGAALDAGVTFVDTARGYGRSEERIGRHLASRRDEVVLSTRVGYDVPGAEDWTGQAVSGGVDLALRTLATDTIDVVFLHSCPLEVLQRGEVVEALHAARDAGKVRVAGYSGENDARAWAIGSGAFGAVQTSVNLADQWSLHHVLDDAASRGLGVVAKRPLANAPWRFAERPVGLYAELYWDRLHTLGLEPADGDWLATALRFSAFAPGVSTAIVGTGSEPHLHQTLAAEKLGPLPEQEIVRWREAYAPHAEGWPGDV